ncbi:ketopantoate reductase family protein [Eoetvoesiella caeni]|uniref:2-dehydropantoate 2-reductase n=1 Tax=Eoetvoesiella caeni TaxID=645616 RepID=A0A366HGQ6_9BURK|nr:2-dehydropantoate 2-reductase [Eoetvoesiella caeni]MCI2807915.1 2-dehydropantoate 2-reductase [Eoetvoesiella caeni]NYT54083.1 2-dehydropantoate 2-reductase [Eoetvoesiella caeni]RBP41833.1 ketopantoate reductase [Eoetvoesiella caeni]
MNASVQARDESPPAPTLHPSLRIGIAGAGAIGCTLAATLAHAGQAVHLLARGANLQAIQRNGIQLTRAQDIIQASVAASASAHELGVQDVLFLCTKAQDLAGLLPALAPMIGPQTCVVPLVNGVPWWYFQGIPDHFSGRAIEAVDPGGALLSALPSEQILGAVVFITAERLGPGAVESRNPMLLVLGELDHTETPRLQRIAAALTAAGLPTRSSPRIRDPLWTKIIANLASNPLSVISGATLQALFSDPRLLPVVRKILVEAMALSAAYGARLEFDPETFIAQAAAMGPTRTSMLQDSLQGHPLELAAIGDSLLELARLRQIPMPITQDIIALTHFRDEATRAANALNGDKK